VTAETIRAGDLSFALDGADLIDLRWGALDVASRIQVTVRDPDWGTVPTTVRSASVASIANGEGVAIEGMHERVGFTWRATVEAREDGELSFAFEGSARRSFEYRRIGVCVLHPWRAYVGAAYEATTPLGPRRGSFPMRIAPQVRVGGSYRPMIEAFSHLAVTFPGGQVLAADLEGDLFELEDQRNWTDGSFKTYPTPLVRSETRRMGAGEHVRQRVVLRVKGAAPPTTEPEVPSVSVGGRTGRVVPPVGMSLMSEPIEGAQHVKVPLVAADPDLDGLVRAEGPIELALALDPTTQSVDRLAPRLRDLPIERVLVSRTDEETASRDLVDEVRARLRLEGVPFVGGTSTFFSELNRNPPDRDTLDGVAFAISPEVHAVDERSIRETLEIQAQVLGQARDLVGASTLHVSSVSLSSDHPKSFADAWTTGCLATLIGAGAASITIDASSSAAARFALLHGAHVLALRVSEPRRIAALAIEGDNGRRAIVVNLMGGLSPFVLNGVEQRELDSYEVRSCDASAASS
jgi:hypothetical protein